MRAEVEAVRTRRGAATHEVLQAQRLSPATTCSQALAPARMLNVRRGQAPVQKTTSTWTLVGTSGVGRTLAPDPLAPSLLSICHPQPTQLQLKLIMNFLQPRLLARPLASSVPSVRSRAAYAKSAESTTEHKSAEPQRPRSGDEEGVSVRPASSPSPIKLCTPFSDPGS